MKSCALLVSIGKAEPNAASGPGDSDGGGGVVWGAVAELSVPVAAPALDDAAREQGAVVGVAGVDRGGGGDPGDRDRGGRVGVRAVAQLAVIVEAPAFDG